MNASRVFVAVFAAAMFAGGAAVVHFGNGRAGKVRTRADIISCHHVSALHGGEDICYGFWSSRGGSPVLGAGRHVNGTIHDASFSDEGKTLVVYARGNTATLPHGTNWRLAVFLWLLSVAAVAALVRDVAKGRRAQRDPPAGGLGAT